MDTEIKTAQNDVYKKSRVFYILEASVEYFLATFVGGAYLAKMTTALGMSDDLTGIITAFVSLGFGFQIFALLLAQKKPIKHFIIIMNLLTQLAFSFLSVIPVIKLPGTVKAVIFIALFLVGEIIKNVIYPAKMAWEMGIVDDHKRGSFTATKEIVSLLSGIVITIGMGSIIDYFEASGNSRGVFIFGGITMFALTAIHTTLLLLIKEKPEKTQKEPIGQLIRESVTDKRLLVLIPLFVFWNIATYSTTPFYGTYQLKELGMSMTLVTVVTAVGSVVRAIVSTPMGRLADKYSFITSLNVCFAIALAAHVANLFAGVGFYTAYVVLHAASMSGINSGIVNLVYDFVPRSSRTSAIAVKNTVVGFAGFFTTLAVSPLVLYIQGKGNKFLFFEHIYAQQILTAFALLMVIACILYLNFVVKPAKKKLVVREAETSENDAANVGAETDTQSDKTE
ncbi:MAG: MFS transporter [Clostridia bacterium]|nr:MFS transporter [Clostridia bacterium]